MKKNILILSLFLLSAFSAVAQTSEKKSLIVSNCDVAETNCVTQHLVRYDFVNGEFSGKEKILTTKTQGVRFDLGGNRIYRNRFIITDWGDVFDISTGKILH